MWLYWIRPITLWVSWLIKYSLSTLYYQYLFCRSLSPSLHPNTDAAFKMTEDNLNQKSLNETNGPDIWTKRGAEEIRRRQLRNLKSESTQTETQSLTQICAQISPKLALKFVIILICILSCIVLFVWRIYLSVYVNAQNEEFENLKSKMTECQNDLKSKMTECQNDLKSKMTEWQNQNDYLRRSYDVSDLLLKEKLNEFDDMKLQIYECRNYHDDLQYAKLAVVLLSFTLLLLGITCVNERKSRRHSLMSRSRLSIQWIADILQAMWCNSTYILCNKKCKWIQMIVKNYPFYPDNSFLVRLILVLYLNKYISYS